MATLASVNGRGIVASRPAAGTAGAMYFATDVAGGTLQRDNGSSYDNIEAASWVSQLDYALGTDVSGLSIPSGTWTDVISNQSFTVNAATSVVQIALEGIGIYVPAGSGDQMGFRLIVDSAGTPINKPCGGAIAPNGGSSWNTTAVIHGTYSLTGLSAGTHTLKIQAQPSVTATLFFRGSTKAIYEHLSMRVIEWY